MIVHTNKIYWIFKANSLKQLNQTDTSNIQPTKSESNNITLDQVPNQTNSNIQNSIFKTSSNRNIQQQVVAKLSVKPTMNRVAAAEGNSTETKQIESKQRKAELKAVVRESKANQRQKEVKPEQARRRI